MKSGYGVAMLMREFYPLRGGYQNQALRLARELVRRDLPVRVFTQRHGALQGFEVHEGIPIHRVYASRTGRRAAFSYLLSSLVGMTRHRATFDVIHANRSSSGLIAGLIGQVLGKPVLYKLTRGDEIDVKGFRRNAWGRLKLFVLKRVVDRFVAITAKIERDLRDLGVAADKIVRIPNGIERDHPLPDEDRARVRASFGWSGAEWVVAFVGRLVHAKGVDWLLDTWKEFAAEDAGARLLIVGDGGERGSLETQTKRLGLCESVAFAGNRDDVLPFLAATDVFVLPSRREGISNSLLEAMSQGLPVIVADDALGGNRELVHDGREGLLVPLGDGRALLQALRALRRDPALGRALGQAGRDRIAREFSIESVADRYVAVYEDLVLGKGPQAGVPGKLVAGGTQGPSGWRQHVPWWLKIAAKLVLGHLPVSYERWRSLGLFRRGGMQDSSYSLRVFEKHLGHAGIGARMNGLTVLELGPGDACASALIARAYGASGCWLVDDAPLATTDIDVYRMLSDHLRKRGLDVPSLSGTSTLAEVAELCHARYLTEGLQSLRSVPDASVDLLWSHSVLEHVKRSELLEVLREMRRIVKPGGVCSHRVDLRDHLSGALNHLRFSEGFWENPFVATSGFYTNRIRFTEMLELFTRAGFAAEVREIDRWSELPTKRSRIAASYRDLSDEELRVWGFHVVLRPAPGSGLG